MEKNIGKIDRAVRIIAGAALLLLGYTTSIWFGVVGAVLLFTAAIAWCPPYAIFGISTCKH